MYFSKDYLLLLFFFLISTLAFSQEQALKTFVQEDLMRDLYFISSDSLQGRGIGVGDGLKKTAEYIQTTAQENGLKPVNNSYSQEVDIFSIHPDIFNSYLMVAGSDDKMNFKSQIICLDNQILNYEFTGETVFAGFGIKDEKTGYNDFEDIDVKGNVVLISTGDLESFGDNEKYSWNDRFERDKVTIAFERGAEAVILITNTNDKKDLVFQQMEKWMDRNSYTLKEQNDEEGEKYFMTTPDFADFLMGGKHKYQKYLSTIIKSQEPNSFLPKNKKVEIHFQKEVKVFPSKNIFGMVEGSDPDSKKEYVVYMAHYDHLGIDDDGDVYNGADDNGSGVTVLLELAKAFSTMKIKPKRSILFLWVTGEEIGMLGSHYYSENPVIPMEKTVACINIDMVGRVFESRDSIWKQSPKMVKDYNGLFTLTNDVWPELNQISDSVCNKLGLIPDNSLPDRFIHSSDQYYFHKNGVPILNVSTGYHADYHKPTDEFSKINFDKMKRIADFCFLIGYEVANAEIIYRTETPMN